MESLTFDSCKCKHNFVYTVELQMLAGQIGTCLHMLRKLLICTTKMVKLKRCSPTSDSNRFYVSVAWYAFIVNDHEVMTLPLFGQRITI